MAAMVTYPERCNNIHDCTYRTYNFQSVAKAKVTTRVSYHPCVHLTVCDTKNEHDGYTFTTPSDRKGIKLMVCGAEEY